MTDADFLREIIATPDDDGPRLIYADWLDELDEHGEPERGEFIRVQCKIAELAVASGHPKTTPLAWSCKCDICEQAKPIRRRADELLYSGRLGNPFGKDSGIVWTRQCFRTSPECVCHNVTFRRGFVAEVTLTSEAWLGGVCQWGCRGAGAVADEDEKDGHSTCPGCNGTGRTPGHADTLVAATPLEVVRLTTMPVLEHRFSSDGFAEWRVPGREKWHCIIDHPVHYDTRQLFTAFLADEWRGICFELPVADPTLVPPEFSPILEQMAQEGRTIITQPGARLTPYTPR